MGTFRILNAANPAQYTEWLKIWMALASCEVFAHPQYVALLCSASDCALCAVMECSTGVILLPFILRPLRVENWVDQDNPYYDIVSPYGFGGPYSKGNCNTALFWREIDHWAEDNGVVASFLRVSPFIDDMEGYPGSVEAVGGNVIRFLTEGNEVVWKDYSPKVRCNVRRAEREGVCVEIDETGERLEDFLNIYYGTMQRRKALDQYYFSEDFFRGIIKNMKGQFAFFHAIHCGKVISTEIVFISQDYIYAFLGGTDEDYFGMHANELIKHRIITMGIDWGKKAYILGGGYAGYDGIFRYKKEFAPRSVSTYKIAKRIHDDVVYKHLCVKRKEYETHKGNNWNGDATYFPLYRANSV